MGARVLWGGPLAFALAAGCVGDIGDGPASEPGTVAQGVCADTPFVRRLTIEEYVATVEATLGVDIELEAVAALPKDLQSDGFSNSAGALIVTLDHVQDYAELAELAVSRIPNIADFAATMASCTDLSPTCAEELIAALSQRVYRGEVAAEEVSALMPIFATADVEGESFENGVGLVLTAMLQSPRFLYRVENEVGENEGEIRALSAYAVANRLSYLLWSAPPDDTLFLAAADDALTTDEAIEAHVRRMLDDPRARETSARYLSDWLGLSRLDNIARDPGQFPEFTDTIAEQMKFETLEYFDHLVWEKQRPLSEIFNTQTTFVGDSLAGFYGFEQVGAGEYDLSDIPERGGLLTQGSILTNGGATASMVGRGIFIMETFLCGEIGSPPPGVDTTPPEVEPGETQRTYSEGRVDNPACGGCHSRMEPLAWGIERYDSTGAYADEDANGNELKQDGYLLFDPGSDPAPYATTAELNELLAESESVKTCMADKATQFAMGRKVHGDPDTTCSLDAIHERFLTTDGTYHDLMVAIALSPMFRSITVQK
jgi:hypothetical protein